jgi:hypothetical protein
MPMLEELKGYVDAAGYPVQVAIGLLPATPAALVALVERPAVAETVRAFSGQRITYPRVEIISRAPSYSLARTNLDLVMRRLLTIQQQVVGDTLYLSMDAATLPSWIGTATTEELMELVGVELEAARVEDES